MAEAPGNIRKSFIVKNSGWLVILLSLALLPIVLQVHAGAAGRPLPGKPPRYGYRVIRSYPHDRQAFTQGLFFADGCLYEGTGLHGRSSLRKVDLSSGRVLKEARLDPSHFGEGITALGDRIVQVTWQSRVGFVYDRKSFSRVKLFTYPHEGWGITYDGKRLIMSDGTSILHLLDPKDFRETAALSVFDGQGPVAGLNELEYVRGAIYANLWPTDQIAVIDPGTGRVTARIELKGLLDARDAAGTDVLNGIAYDAAGDRLFVTGKLWPKVFEIKIVKGP